MIFSQKKTVKEELSTCIFCYHAIQQAGATQAIILYNQATLVCDADHWQGSKTFPYAQGPFPAGVQSLGDGMLHQLAQTTHYWWCWLAIGVSLAYIFLLNVLIVIALTVLPRKLNALTAAHSLRLPGCNATPCAVHALLVMKLCAVSIDTHHHLSFCTSVPACTCILTHMRCWHSSLQAVFTSCLVDTMSSARCWQLCYLPFQQALGETNSLSIDNIADVVCQVICCWSAGARN